MATATVTWDGNSVGSVIELDGVYDTPEVRSFDVDRSRAHGQWPGVDLLGGRAITVTLQSNLPLDNAGWATAQRRLVPTGDEKVLQIQLSGFAGGATVRCNARIRRVAVPVDVDRYQFGVPRTVIEWWATDPRFYADTETTDTVTVQSPEGIGLTFDATFDLGFGGALPSGVMNVENTGNFGAPWTIELQGPLTNPRIEHIGSGATLSLSGTVQAGQTLVIDSLARTIEIDGASRYSWVQPRSQWFDLEPGTNQVRLAAQSGSGSGTLTFRSAWI